MVYSIQSRQKNLYLKLRIDIHVTVGETNMDNFVNAKCSYEEGRPYFERVGIDLAKHIKCLKAKVSLPKFIHG